ncbi:MAG: transcription termination/antitermination protein NusG [Thermodesulfobacteriota bacterium]
MKDFIGQKLNDKSAITLSDSKLWYVIQTKPGNEQRAEFNLSNQGIETFLPLYKAQLISFGRLTEKKKPLFPNYLFAKLELSAHYSQVKWTRGVSKIVAFGDIPVPVSEEVIQAIKSRVGKDNLIELEENWREGDLVEIISGPLKGLQGIFQRKLSDKGRIKILLSMLGIEVPVQIPQWQIKKTANRTPKHS